MIHNIFDFPIYIGKIEKHAELKEKFRSFVSNDENFHIPYGWDSTTTSSFGHKNNMDAPWGALLNEVIPNHLSPFLKNFNPITDIESTYQVWANRYNKGEFQESHNHSSNGAHFSFNYIHQCDPDGGYIVFLDNRQDFWENSGLRLMYDIPYSRKFIPELTEGDVVIFPSCLEHYVSPNTSDKTRITLSGNFTLRERVQ